MNGSVSRTGTFMVDMSSLVWSVTTLPPLIRRRGTGEGVGMGWGVTYSQTISTQTRKASAQQPCPVTSHPHGLGRSNNPLNHEGSFQPHRLASAPFGIPASPMLQWMWSQILLPAMGWLPFWVREAASPCPTTTSPTSNIQSTVPSPEQQLVQRHLPQ